MNNDLLTRRISSAVSGVARVNVNQPSNVKNAEPTEDFGLLLREKIALNSDLTFSKHAVNRVSQRNIEISDSTISRLNDGVKIAQEKGLGDTLVLVDSTAYIVNAQNGTVITTVNNEELKGNVFTNIDGTVIM